MKKSRNSLLALLAVVVVAAVAIGSRVWVWSDGGEHGAAAAIGGPFTLVDGDGATVTDKNFLGRWMLIYFGYTFCPDVCPTSLSVVAGAMDRLPAQTADKLVPVFITVDPERDTPQVMKDYVSAFHPRMVGLTGNAEQIAAAKKAYKVYAAKAKGGDADSYTMDHSSILYLVGPDGRFVAHYPHGTTAEALAADLIKRLN